MSEVINFKTSRRKFEEMLVESLMPYIGDSKLVKSKMTEKHTNSNLVLYYLESPTNNKNPNDMTFEELRAAAYASRHVATYHLGEKRGWVFKGAVPTGAFGGE